MAPPPEDREETAGEVQARFQEALQTWTFRNEDFPCCPSGRSCDRDVMLQENRRAEHIVKSAVYSHLTRVKTTRETTGEDDAVVLDIQQLGLNLVYTLQYEEDLEDSDINGAVRGEGAPRRPIGVTGHFEKVFAQHVPTRLQAGASRDESSVHLRKEFLLEEVAPLCTRSPLLIMTPDGSQSLYIDLKTTGSAGTESADLKQQTSKCVSFVSLRKEEWQSTRAWMEGRLSPIAAPELWDPEWDKKTFNKKPVPE
ncbi:unnamed protein product, partial [Amoebophrya sp. A25]|eukprot:GSA25T00002908001.1